MSIESTSAHGFKAPARPRFSGCGRLFFGGARDPPPPSSGRLSDNREQPSRPLKRARSCSIASRVNRAGGGAQIQSFRDERLSRNRRAGNRPARCRFHTSFMFDGSIARGSEVAAGPRPVRILRLTRTQALSRNFRVGNTLQMPGGLGAEGRPVAKPQVRTHRRARRDDLRDSREP